MSLEREWLWDKPLKNRDPWVMIQQHEQRLRDLEKRFEGANVPPFTINDTSGPWGFSNAWIAHHAYELMEVAVSDPDGDLDAEIQVYHSTLVGYEYQPILSSPVALSGDYAAFGIPDLVTECKRGDFFQVAISNGGYIYAGTVQLRVRRIA